MMEFGWHHLYEYARYPLRICMMMVRGNGPTLSSSLRAFNEMLLCSYRKTCVSS